MITFKGKTIVITGGARGQGAQAARQLACAGATVFITDLLVEEGEALAMQLGSNVSFVRQDVANEDDWAMLGELVAAAGGVDGLVNNAGIYDPKLISETSKTSFVQHMAVNQLGCFLGIKFVEQFAPSTGASIVNVSSVAGLMASKGIAYVGTKWAIRGMTKTAAQELGPKGIRVNSIHPGIIDTKMLDVWNEGDFAARVQMVPLRRAGTVSDAASLVMFLLSDASDYITGAEIAIDGGLSV